MDLMLTDAPSETDRRMIDDGLADYNAAQAGYRDWRPLAVLARHEGRLRGGILGRTSLGLLFVDLVFLDESLRHRKIGGQMLRMVEEEAVRRGCGHGALITISFQAPRFYEKCGWTEFGRVPCLPEGTFRIFMSKGLSKPEA